MRYLFEIAYHGTAYHGWQRQANAHTVQEEVEKALTTILREPTAILGSGRTDTGVHCRQQFFHIECEQALNAQLIYQLNSLLPPDISISSMRQMTPDGHARFSATSRAYEYYIHQHKDPFKNGLSYYLTKPLNVELMNEAAQLLLGRYDFECFSKVKTEVNNFYCNIEEAQWTQPNPGNLVFYIRANRFLRGMVRAIVGSLLEVGLGKSSVADFKQVIASKDRKQAGSAVPALGLYLVAVAYPDDIFID